MNTNLAYQDCPAEELIGGKFVAMSPRPSVNHNHVSFNIARIFADYLKGKRCTPFADGVDLYLTDEDRFIPDMMVVCDPDKVKADGVYGAPDLVVEVLSPSTAQYDRGRKMKVYAQCGVREYWIVSPEARSVDVYLLEEGRFELRGSYSVYPDYMLIHMTEEEKAEMVTEFYCHLYDDLPIRLDDIFSDMF